MEKEKNEKEKKEQEVKDKKFKDGMVKVDELEKEEKFCEVWMKVFEIIDYFEKVDEICKCKLELLDKFFLIGLFVIE